MARFRLTLEYDGAGFQGWQLQPDVRTVQGELEAALAKLAGESVRVIGAGRTDAGVHARAQVAHVDLAAPLTPIELRRALNAVLESDLAVVDVRDAVPGFHARRDTTSKTYVYRILNRAVSSPERRHVTWHLRSRLDDAAMREAASRLRGAHDFAAFRGAPGGPPVDEDTHRTLDRLEVTRRGDELEVVAQGPSFLRYMVRNLAGGLAHVGRGRITPSELEALLVRADRALAPPTAPAHGLRLERVDYAEQPGNPEPAQGVGSADRRSDPA